MYAYLEYKLFSLHFFVFSLYLELTIEILTKTQKDREPTYTQPYLMGTQAHLKQDRPHQSEIVGINLVMDWAAST